MHIDGYPMSRGQLQAELNDSGGIWVQAGTGANGVRTRLECGLEQLAIGSTVHSGQWVRRERHDLDLTRLAILCADAQHGVERPKADAGADVDVRAHERGPIGHVDAN